MRGGAPESAWAIVGECKKYWSGKIEGKSGEEQQRKEDIDVNVCERTGKHPRRNSPCGTSGLSERNIGHALA